MKVSANLPSFGASAEAMSLLEWMYRETVGLTLVD